MLTLTLKPYETVIFEYSNQEDRAPAMLLQARAIETKQVQLTFDKTVDISQAHFDVIGKQIVAKALGADLRTVTLTLAGELANRETVQVTYDQVKDNSAYANSAKGKVSVTAYAKGRLIDLVDLPSERVVKDNGITGKGSFSVTVKANLSVLNQTLAQQEDQWKLAVDQAGRVVFNVKGLEVKSAPYRQLKAEDRGVPDELVTIGKEVLITAMRQVNGSLRLYVNGELHNTAYSKAKVNEKLLNANVTVGGAKFQGSITRFILENEARDFRQVKVLESELGAKAQFAAVPVVAVTATSYDANDNGPKPASHVNDHNTTTYWASDPNQDNTQTRQTLTLELAENNEISVVVYTPRPIANAVGNIKKLYLETSIDGEIWQRAMILEGNADNTKSLNANDVQPQGILIHPVKAKYVRLTALETAHWHPYLENKVVAASALSAYHIKQPVTQLPNIRAYLGNMLEKIIVNELAPKTKLVLAPVVNVTATSYDAADNGPKPASNVNDGNSDTYWASAPSQDNTQMRQTLTLELAEHKTLALVMYTPRSVPNAVGNVKKLYLEMSLDGRHWMRATIVDGNADNTKTLDATNPQPKGIAINPVMAKYVRLTALETAHWHPYLENKVVAAAALTAYYDGEAEARLQLAASHLRQLLDQVKALDLKRYTKESVTGLLASVKLAEAQLITANRPLIEQQYSSVKLALDALVPNATIPKPQEPVQPVTPPVQPKPPVKPVEPAKPATPPVQPKPPVKPVEPAKPATPPAQPKPPVKPVEPAKPATPPTQPKPPVKPVEPANPVTPPVQPKPPVKPVEPVQPVTPPVQPKPPVKPVAPAKPVSHPNRRYNRLSKRNRPLP